MRLRLNFSSSIVLWLAMLVTSRPAVAQSVPESGTGDATNWSVTEITGHCARAAGFGANVRGAIPNHLRGDATAAEMQIRVHTQTEGSGSSATVDVFDSVLGASAGSRTIRSTQAGCSDLGEQLSLVVGILVEAGRGAPSPVVEPDPPADEEEEPSEDEDLEEEEAETRRSRKPRQKRMRYGPPLQHQLRAVGTFGWGLLPDFYGGGEISWSVRRGKMWPIRVGGAFWLPSSTKRGQGEARFTAGYATLASCPQTQGPRVTVGGCALIGVGVMGAKTEGYERNDHVHEPLVVLGLEAHIAIHLAGPLDLVLGMQALGVPLRPRFVYYSMSGTSPQVHQAVPVALQGHTGLRLRFPDNGPPPSPTNPQ